MGALVGGEAAGEADDEGVGIDLVEDFHDCRGITLVCKPFGLEVTLDKVDEFLFELTAHFPDVLVVDIEDPFPCFGVARIGKHLFAEAVEIEFFPFAGSPCRHVDAVGDVTDMAFFPRVTSPDAGEHLL